METQKSPAAKQGKNLNPLIIDNDSIKNIENQAKNDNVVNLYESYNNYRLPFGFHKRDNHLSKSIIAQYKSKNGEIIEKEEIKNICSFFVVDRIIRQENNQLLIIKLNNNREIAADAGIVADYKKLAEFFCKYIDIVNAKIAKDIIEYISSFLELNNRLIEIKNEVNETGWNDDYKNFNLPAVNDKNVYANDITDKFYTNGSEEAQINFVKEIFTNHAGASVIILLGLVSTLIKYLNMNNYIIFIKGKTGKGKTVSCQILNSLFGNPARLKLTLNMTLNALERTTSNIKDLPNICDEVETSGKTAENINNNIVSIIYNVFEGIGRSRMQKNQTLQKINTYRSFLFLTSERSILSILNENTTNKANLGTLRRVLEINTDKIELFNKDVNFSNIIGNISDNFGHFIKIWIDYLLTGNNLEKIKDNFTLNRENDKDKLNLLNLIEIIYSNVRKILDIQENENIINAMQTIRNEETQAFDNNVVNVENKYIDNVQEFITINQANFFDKEEAELAEREDKTYKINGKLYGQFNSNNIIYLTNDGLQEICRKYKIEKETLLNILSINNILESYKVVKINKTTARAYVLKLYNDEEALNSTTTSGYKI